MRNNWFVFPEFCSRNVGNSRKCEKNITPPPPPNHPHIWDTKSEQGNRGYNGYRFQLSCPHLLFGETTSHLTSKWRGTFQYYFFNVENSIKSEMRKNCFSKKKKSTTPPPPPPPRIFFLHQIFYFFFNVGNSMKREENMIFWRKKFLKFYFFQYLKKS